MFTVSTVRGLNLVFNDTADLENHVGNLQAYLDSCRENRDDKVPVYGIYPNDADPQICSLITKSLQNVFSVNPEPPTEEELKCVDNE